MIPVRALRPFVRRRVLREDGAPRCELCAVPIDTEHRHLVDRQRRRICCACPACAVLFDHEAARGFRSVPRRVLRDQAGAIEERDLLAAGIPVRLAFLFLHGDRQRWIAIYPSPAGSTEVELEEAQAAHLLAASPLFAEAQADVEAVLLHGPRGSSRIEALLVPIDRCYELTASLRRHWKGFEGGREVHEAIGAFFAALQAASRELPRRAT
ncbi:DUF5947 family protein [Vulgatibacter sp.]|uniref:DUF5947 family protein n=1 Tax=Vulgatibacter sp. TaxID=1971226 RepID=UPI003563568F